MLMVHFAEEVCGISGKMEMIEMNKDGRPRLVKKKKMMPNKDPNDDDM